MKREGLAHLWPTLEMVAEELNLTGTACRVARGAGERRFRGARLYAGQEALSEDTLYVLRPEDAARFPANGFACACLKPTPGRAGCLVLQDCAPEAALDALLTLFERCWEAEARLDELVYRGGSLTELCELGAALLDNPICVHDDWFVMLGRSGELAQVMPPDYIMSSSREFIPRIIVEDFKNDADYLETYAHRTARLWDASPGGARCVYANLWEGEVYRGRLLVVEYHRGFRALDYALTELLAQRVLILLNRARPGQDRPYRSMDDIVFDLLAGKPVASQEESQFLGTLLWRREDALLCVRLEPQQQGESSVLAHALHSDLFQAFPQAYILFTQRQQGVVLNLERERQPMSMLRHRLSPLCRDYCLYAGISSPVSGLGELNIAWTQAQIALEKAFRLRSERWLMSFGDCALEYMLDKTRDAMKPVHLVAPELLRVKALDEQRGTQYYDTLRTYLLNERDIPRTSQALIIHRTTLLYRLRKLQEAVSLDMEDPEERLRLLMSIWILDQEAKR